MVRRPALSDRQRRFRYCGDRVFLVSFGIYLLNRLVLRPYVPLKTTTFFAWYLNDVLCIPFCLPPVLYLYRRLGLRRRDAFPTRLEIIVHFLVWSIFFEWIAPVYLHSIFPMAVSDPWDVVAYAVGAAIAGQFWGAWSIGRMLSHPTGGAGVRRRSFRQARVAYWLACVSSLSMVWRAKLYSPTHPDRMPSVPIQVVWWCLCLCAPLSILLGSMAHGKARGFDGWQFVRSYARASVTLGIVASGAIFLNGWSQWETRNYINHYGQSCKSHEKNLATGLLMYAQDYDERLPGAAGWKEALYPYEKNEQVFRCPQEVDDTRPSYGLNARLAGMQTSQILSVNTTVLIVDTPPGQDAVVASTNLLTIDRHAGAVNAAFLDGHIAHVDHQAIVQLEWQPQLTSEKR